MITVKRGTLALLVFLTGASQSMLRASPCVNDADCILAGFDYFVTGPGTFFTINGTVVPLTGIPDPTKFGADTIVQRFGNIDVFDNPGATQTVGLQMIALNLTGVDPGPGCPGGNNPCNVFIRLDPGNATLGNLVFTQTVAGEGKVDPSCGGGTLPCEGTYTSFFDVFFDLSFTTLGGTPLPCDPIGDTTCLQPHLTLNGNGSWTDDNAKGLFVVGGQVTETHPAPPGVHNAQQIPTPEPGTLVLLGMGLGLVAISRRWRVRG